MSPRQRNDRVVHGGWLYEHVKKWSTHRALAVVYLVANVVREPHVCALGRW